MRFWRICRRAHHKPDGEGARLVGGRWNRPGRPVVYCSLNLSLAALEVLVHMRVEQLPADYVAQIFTADGLQHESITTADLPPGWPDPGRGSILAEIGDRWLVERRSAIAIVPSVVIYEENNVLLNPQHPDFNRITVSIGRSFQFDVRLLHAKAGAM